MKKNRYKAKKGRAESLSGSVYESRWTLGKGSDVRMRHILENDYGKRAAPEPPVPSGLPGFPRRTMIRG